MVKGPLRGHAMGIEGVLRETLPSVVSDTNMLDHLANQVHVERHVLWVGDVVKVHVVGYCLLPELGFFRWDVLIHPVIYVTGVIALICCHLYVCI